MTLIWRNAKTDAFRAGIRRHLLLIGMAASEDVGGRLLVDFPEIVRAPGAASMLEAVAWNPALEVTKGELDGVCSQVLQYLVHHLMQMMLAGVIAVPVSSGDSKGRIVDYAAQLGKECGSRLVKMAA